MKLARAIGFLVLDLISFSACESEVAIPQLYSLSREDQARAARLAGLDFRSSELHRNSDGTRLYFLFTYDKRVLAVSADGTTTLQAPGPVPYLDDAGSFVAWSDDVRLGFHLPGGKFVKTAWPDGHSGNFGVDPGGRFFFVAREPKRTILSALDAPDTVLAESAFQGDKLFHRNDSLYLFGRIFDGQSSQRELFVDVFVLREGAWARTRSIRIPRGRSDFSPFCVVDMEPWSERVLIVDVRDLPFSSRYYLHDLASGARTPVIVDREPAVFLKTDVAKGLS